MAPCHDPFGSTRAVLPDLDRSCRRPSPSAMPWAATAPFPLDVHFSVSLQHSASHASRSLLDALPLELLQEAIDEGRKLERRLTPGSPRCTLPSMERTRQDHIDGHRVSGRPGSATGTNQRRPQGLGPRAAGNRTAEEADFENNDVTEPVGRRPRGYTVTQSLAPWWPALPRADADPRDVPCTCALRTGVAPRARGFTGRSHVRHPRQEGPRTHGDPPHVKERDRA